MKIAACTDPTLAPAERLERKGTRVRAEGGHRGKGKRAQKGKLQTSDTHEKKKTQLSTRLEGHLDAEGKGDYLWGKMETWEEGP